MARWHRTTRPLHRWLLGLGILLAACGPQGIAGESALSEEADGGTVIEGDEVADAHKSARSRITLKVYVNGERAALLRVGSTSALDAATRVRAAILGMTTGGSVVFELFDEQTYSTVSFLLPGDVFLGRRTEGLPLVPASLVPSSFLYYSWHDGSESLTSRFFTDYDLFDQELRSLSTVTFGSFEAQIGSDLEALARDNSRVAHDPAAYRVLARMYYTLIVGAFSDAAQATMATPRRSLGAAAWAFVAGYLGFRAWARRERLIASAAPLILTTAIVTSMATSVNLPPELFQQTLVFLCGG